MDGAVFDDLICAIICGAGAHCIEWHLCAAAGGAGPGPIFAASYE